MSASVDGGTADLLRFVGCGSVDDGKSTLIGRLLYEAGAVYADELAAVTAESMAYGTPGDGPDLALLLDGLTAEREQGITIDVAYRYFRTARRRFIVADAPGHEHYTRNMVTGASTADAAVIVVDARKGVLTQTRRHTCVVSLLGVTRVALAINKLDLVDYSREAFARIEREYRAFARQLGLADVACIPVSALRGDNITRSSANTPWYGGPTLLELLESMAIDVDAQQRSAFRMPVQCVNRAAGLRGYGGFIAAGTVRPGDAVRVLPSGHATRVATILSRGGDLPLAVAGQSCTLALADALDVSRGDLLCAADDPADVADQFEATVVWLASEPMLPGRRYLMKIGSRTVTIMLAQPKYRLDVDSLEHLAARTLEQNEIGICNLSTDQPVAFDPYRVNRDTGGFIVIDRLSCDTVGAGLLHFALRRAHNIQWQALEIDKQARSRQNGHRPCVVWFTGLSGSGKSTIANAVEKKLHAAGRHTYLLDGDNVRHGLSRDLGFTEADRVENIRRVAEVARLMADAGLIVLVAFISPFRAERRLARDLVVEGEFCEVFVDAPLAVAEARDAKGLYAKARAGRLENFTGIDSPYEAPERPDLRIDSVATAPEHAADAVIAQLALMGVFDVP